MLLDRVGLDGSERVLELACGAGLLLPDIAERAPAARVVGVDLVEEMLRLAPPTFDRVIMDATRLAFMDGSFDSVVCSFALFHLPDPLEALRGMRMALRPAGVLGTTTWGTDGTFPALDVSVEELDAFGAAPDPAAGFADGVEQVNSPDKMRAILGEAGFQNIEVDAAPWERRWELDAFIDYRTRLGAGRRRLATLDPEARSACVARIRERLSSLPEETLVDRDEVVLSTAVRP
jgi:ubiquinone/menaquinone biosynthesis C-methylase UbiE